MRNAAQSNFFAEFSTARGDKAVQVTQWRQHSMGVLRELTFVSIVKVQLTLFWQL